MGDCGRRPQRAPLDAEAYRDPFQLEMFADEMSLLDDTGDYAEAPSFIESCRQLLAEDVDDYLDEEKEERSSDLERFWARWL